MEARGPRQARSIATTAALALACALAAPTTAAAAVPSDFAGVHLKDGADAPSRTRRDALRTQAAAGLRVARVWFYWSAIETQPGRFDFSRYDPVVEDAARNGVRLLPVLIDPPAFRSSAPPGPQRGTY